MRHYFDAVLHPSTGAALEGVLVRIFDENDALVDIYADANSTPIETVSGEANAAKTDGDGMFSLYVGEGAYTVRFYQGDTVLKTITNVNLGVDVTRMELSDATGAEMVGTSDGSTVQEALTARITHLSSRAAMASYGTSHRSVYLTELGREGLFVWDASDLSAEVTADTQQGIYVPPSSDTTGASGAWVRQHGGILKPSYFGAAEDGVTNDLTALTAMFDHVGDGVSARIDGDHVVNALVELADKNDFVVSGCGSIKIADGVGAGYGTQAMLVIRCTNFVIEDLTFDGNRANRSPSGETGASNLDIWECSYFAIRRVKSNNSTLDGILLTTSTPAVKSSHCHDFVIEDCSCDNNYRQGISAVHAYDGMIWGGSYTNTNGTAPQAGIDLEADPGDPDYSVENILIEGVRCEGNAGYGIQVAATAKPRNIRIVDCDLIDNDAGAISFNAISGSIVRPFISGFTNSATRGAIDIDANAAAGNLLIDRPIFRGVTASTGTRPLVYVHASSAGNVVVRDIDVDSCLTGAFLSAPKCKMLGGRIGAATAGNAIYLIGAGCVADGVSITNFANSAIRVEADNATVRNNVLSEPTSNDSGGAIFHQSGTGCVIEGNRVSRAASAAGYGIVSSVSAHRVCDNVVTNFTGNPFALTSPVINRANLADGAMVAETAIAT